MVILNRFLDRFANRFISSEMDDGIDFVFGKNGFGRIVIGYIDLIELRTNVSDGFDTVKHRFLGVVEIVGDNRGVSALDELHHRLASDEA